MTKSLNAVGASTYQSIKRDIIFGDLAPASKLKLETLRKNYNASMSTLRETLNRLASEGFVDALDQRGFFVTPVSKEDLMEVANLRVLLECHALKLSIDNGDTDWEGNLVSAHHKLSSMEQKMLSGDDSQKEDWKRYDWEFHLALIAAFSWRDFISANSFSRLELIISVGVLSTSKPMPLDKNWFLMSWPSSAIRPSLRAMFAISMICSMRSAGLSTPEKTVFIIVLENMLMKSASLERISNTISDPPNTMA